MRGINPGGVWQAHSAGLGRTEGSARGRRPQTPPVLCPSFMAPPF